MNNTTGRLISYCRENNRICPKPTLWNQLWELLPARKRTGLGWEPPLPLILAAWHETPAMARALRPRQHIEWADKHGSLDKVAVFLRALKEEDWYHLDE